MTSGISNDQVLEWLRSVELEGYYDAFEAAGITPFGFISLTVQDYQNLGITKLVDKQRLFRLIMTLKKQDDLVQSLQKHEMALQEEKVSIQAQELEPKSNPTPEIQSHKPPTYNEPPKQKIQRPKVQPEQESEPKVVEKPACVEPVYKNPNSLAKAKNDIYDIPNIHPDFNMAINKDYKIRGIPTNILTVLPTPDEFEKQVRQRIRVVVRKRPLLSHEIARGEHNIVTCDAWNQCSVHEPKIKVDLTKYTDIHSFTFDQVFGENSTNEEIYKYTAKPLINILFTGGKATCFAYGQTGSGKTFTMMEKKTGIYVLAAKDIFQNIEYMNKYGPQNLIDMLQGCRGNVNGKIRLPPMGVEAYTAFFEIYGGNLYDLLNDRNKLFAREDTKGKVNVAGLVEKRIESVDQLFAYIDAGLTSRATGTTSANADSSRSHAILQIILRYPPREDELKLYQYKYEQVKAGALPPEELQDRPKGREFGKISFIDLAGSERAADTMNSDRQTRMEGAEINKSLLSLKECIRALDIQSGHTPFRGSKLTMVLKDSFIGEAKTVMIANISPTNKSSENTLNTLHYSDRVKELGARGGKSRMVPTLKLMENAAEVVLQSGGGQYGAVYAVPPGKDGHKGGRSMSSSSKSESMEVIEAPDERSESQQDSMSEYNTIVNKIYNLEDDIIQDHRSEVDQMMKLMKKEVTLLNGIEQNKITMDQWINDLSAILQEKLRSITHLEEKVRAFKEELAREEDLSRSRSMKGAL